VAFTPGLFDFFRELRENNNRPWFEANKRRYEADVQGPLVAFVIELSSRLHAISPHFIADPRTNGGSIFRIYRDTRFSPDKTPYKTHGALHFSHDAGKEVHGRPGFYLHLGPDHVFAGGGIWRPETATQGQIRDAIIAKPDAWRRATARDSLGTFELGGDQLARPPRGYDPAHPLIDDLRRKDFIVGAPLDEAEACRPDFIDRYAEGCRTAAPFMRFVTEAVGLAW
jgi:uncharacterized protein (TIGR02453 family)